LEKRGLLGSIKDLRSRKIVWNWLLVVLPIDWVERFFDVFWDFTVAGAGYLTAWTWIQAQSIARLDYDLVAVASRKILVFSKKRAGHTHAPD
jgi:hypothetical protein